MFDFPANPDDSLCQSGLVFGGGGGGGAERGKERKSLLKFTHRSPGTELRVNYKVI